jgi:hypothetical protein|nr:MAG TPA_asm: hypothetical protein [Caudoviricetes sp.]
MNDKEIFDVLKPYMPMWCQKVLPAVFDQSLSYYELLCKILQKYNELVAVVNAHSEKLENHETRIVTLETITKEIQQKLAELDEAVKQNTANIAALTERVNGHDAEIATIQAFIDGLANSTAEHGFEINRTANTISFNINGTTIPYQSAVDTLIKRGAQVMKGNFAGGSVMLGGFDTSVTAGRIFGFCVGIENGDLHYITLVANTNASDANSGTIGNWKSVEVLDITDIMQSEGTEQYKTISQKVITDLLKKKLAADMGITGATAGQYLNIAAVDGDGKPLTYGFGSPGGGGSGVDIVQTTGQSTTSVMSQKATTDAINKVKTSTAAGVSVVYPTTAGGTDGKFVDGSGATLTRAELLAGLIGADGKNRVFTVKKTGSSDWQRITWFKSAAGEGLYDFAWYETDGTSAKAGVDRLTMATNGQFAVSEQSSVDVPVSGVVKYTDFGSAFFKMDGTTPAPIGLSGSAGQTQNTTCYLKLPFECNSVEEAYAYLDGLGGLKCHLQLVTSSTDVDIYYGIIFKPFKQTSVVSGSEYTPNYTLCGFAPYNVVSKNQSVRLAFVMQEVYSSNKTLISGTMRALITSGV